MNPTLRQFRVTVAVVLFLEAVTFICGYFELFPTPSGSTEAFTWDMYGSILRPRYVEASNWIWYLVHIGSLVGLLLLWRPALYIATVALIYGVFILGWSGVRVSAPLESFVTQISFVLYLFALGMAFFGATVSNCFGALPRTNAANGT